MLGARPIGWEYPDGDSYAALQLPGALLLNSAQTYEAAALAGLGPISGVSLENWLMERLWRPCPIFVAGRLQDRYIEAALEYKIS